MKRLLVAAGAGVGSVLSAWAPSYAQEVTAPASRPIEVANLFTWLTQVPPDWQTGILYFVVGAIGALVVVFTMVGGAVPGTAAVAHIEAGMKRVEAREKLLDDLIKATPRNAEEIKVIEAAANNLRDDISSERHRMFLISGALYMILGGAFAAMLAQDVLQGLFIGAGWTSFLGALGLQRDYAERKAIKDDVIERFEKLLGQQGANSVGQPVDRQETRELMADAEISRAL